MMAVIAENWLRVFRRYLPSALTFLAGTGSFLVADVIIGRFAATNDVKDWVLLKSIMLPLATVALLGIDQVVVREPSKLQLYIRPTIALSLFISAMSSFLLWISGFYAHPTILFFAVFGVASSYFFFGVFRSTLNFNMAQFARDGWKALFLVILIPIYFAFSMPIYVAFLMAIAVMLVVVTWKYATSVRSDMNEVHDEVDGFKSALGVSWPFCLGALSLSIASYGELLLLNGFGGDAFLPEYFRSTLLYSMPIITFNTLFVTYLGSAIRERPEKYSKLMLKYKNVSYWIIAIFPVASLLFGLLISPIVFRDHSTPIEIAILLSLTAGIRVHYTIISSFVGVLAVKTEMQKISVMYFAIAISTPIFCFIVYQSTQQLILAVAITGVYHWVARNSIGWRLLQRVCNRNARQCPTD